MNTNRKDIAEKLKRLAERILDMEGTSDLESLKSDHMSVYEDLVLLSLEESKSENTVEAADPAPDPAPHQKEQDELIPEKPEPEGAPKRVSEEQEYPTLSDLFVPTFNEIKEDMSQKEEFKDTVSLDETEKLFETRKEEIRQLSLNDRLVGNSIQIGLNDRIAFVNKLFNFSQSDFNKVLSRLNACSTRDEALHYVQYQVKTAYNWKGKEDLEERFISLIERKFMS